MSSVNKPNQAAPMPQSFAQDPCMEAQMELVKAQLMSVPSSGDLIGQIAGRIEGQEKVVKAQANLQACQNNKNAEQLKLRLLREQLENPSMINNTIRDFGKRFN